MAPNKQKLLDAARDYTQKGNLPKAIREYQKVMELGMGDVRVLLKIGDLQSKLGQNREAIQTYMQVAAEHAETGFLLKAAAMYKRILQIDSRLLEVHKSLAEVYHQMGLLSDAMAFYNSAGELLAAEDRIPEHIDILRRMILLDPENVGVRIKLAETFSRAEQLDDAVEQFAEAAQMLREAGRMDDWIKVVERLLYHRADDADLIKALARVYLERREPMAALTRLQIVYKRDPEDVVCLGLLIEIFDQLGQPDKGTQVRREKARTHDQRREKEAAAREWERVLDHHPGDPEALKALGRTAAPLLLDADILRPLTEDNPSLRVEDLHPMPQQHAVPTASVAARPTPAEPTPAPDPQAEVQRLLIETDVYLRYNLFDKALGHLESIFNIDPHNVEGYERLKQIRLAQGDLHAANEVLLYLARLCFHWDYSRTIHYLREAMELIAYNEEANSVAAELGLSHLDIFPEHAQAANPFADLVDEVSVDSFLASVTADFGAFQNAGAASLDHDSRMETGVHNIADLIKDDGGTDVFAVDDMELLGAGDLGSGSEPDLRASSPEVLAAAHDMDDLDLDIDVDSLADEVDLDELPEMGALQPVPNVRGLQPAPLLPPQSEENATSVLSVAHMMGVARNDTAPRPPVEPVAADEDDLDDLFLSDEDDEPAPAAAQPAALVSMDTFGATRSQATAPVSDELRLDLEEIDFYIEQGLYSDAHATLSEVIKRFPHHPEVHRRQSLLADVPADDLERGAGSTAESLTNLQPVAAPAPEPEPEPEPAPAPAPPAPAPAPRPAQTIPRPTPVSAARTPIVTPAPPTPAPAPPAPTPAPAAAHLPLPPLPTSLLSDEPTDNSFDLGVAFREMGLLDEAIEELRLAIQAGHNVFAALFLIARSLLEQGHAEEAIAFFRDALRYAQGQEPLVPHVHYHIAVAYQHHGDATNARRILQQLAPRAALFPDFSARVQLVGG